MQTEPAVPSNSDRCIVILQKTHDGDALAPRHLKLVEIMCNNQPFSITPAIESAFNELYQQVVAGTYDHTTQWLYGIEGLTRDHVGYVLWRGTIVEHYSFKDADREREAATQLAARCRDLEARDIPVNASTVLYPVFTDMPAGSPYLTLLLRLYSVLTDEKGKPCCVIVALPNHQGRALEFASGQLVAKDYKDVVAAYHGCGYAPNTGFMEVTDAYSATVNALQAGGFTPELVNPLLN